MDHMIVLSYDYSNRNRRRRQTNAHPSRAILKAMAVRRCDTKRIAQCSMTRASLEATGCPSGDYSLHIAPSAARATINLTMMQQVLTLLAVLMAIAMRQYYTAHIARWKRFVNFIKATKCHHWMSTCSDIIKGTRQLRLRLFRTFHCEKSSS